MLVFFRERNCAVSELCGLSKYTGTNIAITCHVPFVTLRDFGLTIWEFFTKLSITFWDCLGSSGPSMHLRLIGGRRMPYRCQCSMGTSIDPLLPSPPHFWPLLLSTRRHHPIGLNGIAECSSLLRHLDDTMHICSTLLELHLCPRSLTSSFVFCSQGLSSLY